MNIPPIPWPYLRLDATNKCSKRPQKFPTYYSIASIRVRYFKLHQRGTSIADGLLLAWLLSLTSVLQLRLNSRGRNMIFKTTHLLLFACCNGGGAYAWDVNMRIQPHDEHRLSLCLPLNWGLNHEIVSLTEVSSIMLQVVLNRPTLAIYLQIRWVQERF